MERREDVRVGRALLTDLPEGILIGPLLGRDDQTGDHNAQHDARDFRHRTSTTLSLKRQWVVKCAVMRKAIASGQNQQQIVAAKLTKDFNEKTQEAVLGQPS